MIAESWERQKEVKNIMLFLQEHQVSSSYAAKIYKQYGNESLSVSVALIQEKLGMTYDDIQA
ncbi:MAG: helix-hairpin-helix domain-containing protein [Lachnospiraceae bacterium]